MRNGRPLRFLTVTLGGWTALRLFMLLPDTVPPALRHPQRSGLLVGRAEAEPARAPAPAVSRTVPGAVQPPPQPILPTEQPERRLTVVAEDDPLPFAAAQAVRRFTDQVKPQQAPAAGALPPPLRPTRIAAAPSRLAASAWLLARGGSDGTLLGGQLGGSQAGVRLTYALGERRRLALAARIATPLAGRGREAAFGIEWQPTRAPVRLIAEQRFALDGGRGGPTLMAIGGINPMPVAAGFRLESYAQAGAIARDGVEAFANGAARLTRPIATVAGATLDLGAGTWGAAQRGAARLDFGPSVGLVIPVAHKAVRVTLDYRERVAGAARPGSGLALAIGSDF